MLSWSFFAFRERDEVAGPPATQAAEQHVSQRRITRKTSVLGPADQDIVCRFVEIMQIAEVHSARDPCARHVCCATNTFWWVVGTSPASCFGGQPRAFCQPPLISRRLFRRGEHSFPVHSSRFTR